MREDPPDPAAGEGTPAPAPGSVQHHQLLYRQLLQQSQQPTMLDLQPGSSQGGSSSGSGDGYHEAHQREETQSKVQVQQPQNPLHQAHAMQAAQQKSQSSIPAQPQQHVGGPSWKGQEIVTNNMRMQDLMSLQAVNQRAPPQNFVQTEKGNSSLASGNMLRMPQQLQSTKSMQGPPNNQLAMAQVQAMQSWALDNNVDPTQVVQLWQSAGLAAMQKQSEAGIGAVSHQPLLSAMEKQIDAGIVEGSDQPYISSMQKQSEMGIGAGSHQPFLPPMKQQQLMSNSAHLSSSSEMSGQAGSVKNRAVLPPGSLSSGGVNTAANSNNIHLHQHQLAGYGRENQSDKVGRYPNGTGNGALVMHLPQSSGGQSQGQGHSDTKLGFAEAESIQMQHFKSTQQLPQQLSQPAILPREDANNHIPSQGGAAQMCAGFTKEQLHVLKAQILAFRRIKRGDDALPEEVLRAIAHPPLDLQLQHPSGMVNLKRPDGNIIEENARHAETSDNVSQPDPSRKHNDIPKDESLTRDDKATATAQMQARSDSKTEPAKVEPVGKLEQNDVDSVKSEPDVDLKTEPAKVEPVGKLEQNDVDSVKSEPDVEKGS